MTEPRRKRTSSEILAAQIEAKRAREAEGRPIVPKKRRTNAQIEADRLALEQRIAEEAERKVAHSVLPRSKRRTVTVHFLLDAVVTDYVNGKVFYRGEELTLTEGTPEWDLYVDRYGNFLFDKTVDEQYEEYGDQRWGEGPWPFQTLDLSRLQWEEEWSSLDGSGNKLNYELTPEEIKAVERINAKRAKQESR